jgi:hypothetical protein
MENQDSQPPKDSPESALPKQPLLSDKPRTPMKVRRADAEPLYERIADKDTEQVITHLRPVKPAGSGINPLGLIIPVGVTLAIAAVGYFGFLHVKEHNARMIAAENAATDAEAGKETRRRAFADMTTDIRDTQLRIPAEIEKAKREAAAKATAEFNDELNTLTRAIEETTSAGRATAQKTESDLRGKIADLKSKADALAKKADTIEAKNREIKVWLNAHTQTMHPKY